MKNQNRNLVSIIDEGQSIIDVLRNNQQIADVEMAEVENENFELRDEVVKANCLNKEKEEFIHDQKESITYLTHVNAGLKKNIYELRIQNAFLISIVVILGIIILLYF